MMNDGGPAFPNNLYDGMSLRDYFAAAAITSLYASSAGTPIDMGADELRKMAAQAAYATADAMLAEREKTL